jgi:hypothetical protein
MAVFGELLFFKRNGATLDDVLRHHAGEGVRQEVERLPSSAFEQTDEEIAKQIAAKMALTPLQVDFDGAKPNVQETTVDVSQSFDYGFPRGGRAPGLEVTKTIPFSGDRELWHLQTNPFNMNPPRGEVLQKAVRIGTTVPTAHGDQAASYLEATIREIKECMQRQEAQIARHNAGLEQAAIHQIRARRSRVGAASDLLKKLGG